MTSTLGKFVEDKIEENKQIKLSYVGQDFKFLSDEDKYKLQKIEIEDNLLNEIKQICLARGRY